MLTGSFDFLDTVVFFVPAVFPLITFFNNAGVSSAATHIGMLPVRTDADNKNIVFRMMIIFKGTFAVRIRIMSSLTTLQR